MNREPIRYLQTDSRWKHLSYAVKGETATIGGSGCGPTAAAMAASAMLCRAMLPPEVCQWALDHGYKAKNQGTYYSFFAAFFAHLGIKCEQLSWVNTYHKPDHANHDKVERMLQQGCYAIALMKKGHWTKSGHFVLLWWQDGKVRICDPASTRADRTNADVRTFRNEAAYYFMVDARSYNHPQPPAMYPAVRRVDASKLWVRTGPGTNYDKAGQLRRGDDIQVLSYKDGWYKTPIGYIAAEYAVPIPVPPKPEPEPEKKPENEKEDMIHMDITMKELEEKIAKVTERTIDKMMTDIAALPASEWAEDAIETAKAWGVTADGSRPQAYAQRQEVQLMMVKGFEHHAKGLPKLVRDLVVGALDELTVDPDELDLDEDVPELGTEDCTGDACPIPMEQYDPDEYPSVDQPEQEV